MAILRPALCCFAASAMLVSTGCKQIAPYPAAQGKDASVLDTKPAPDAPKDIVTSERGSVVDGVVDATAVDATIVDTTGDGGVVNVDTGAALDAVLDNPLPLEAGVVADAGVVTDSWTALPPCASGATKSDKPANAYSTLTWTSGSNSWIYTDTGTYTQLKFGRKDNAPAWLVVHFRVRLLSSALPPFDRAEIFIKPSIDGTYDTLDVCVQETLDATPIDGPTTPPALLCRRWPEDNDKLILDSRSRSTGVVTPDVAPLIQQIVDGQPARTYPSEMNLQFWIGAAVETGPDSLLSVTNIYESTGTKLALWTWWCN